MQIHVGELYYISAISFIFYDGRHCLHTSLLPYQPSGPVAKQPCNLMGSVPGFLMTIHHPYDTQCLHAQRLESHFSPRDRASLRKIPPHRSMCTLTPLLCKRTKTGGGKWKIQDRKIKQLWTGKQKKLLNLNDEVFGACVHGNKAVFFF